MSRIRSILVQVSLVIDNIRVLADSYCSRSWLNRDDVLKRSVFAVEFARGNGGRTRTNYLEVVVVTITIATYYEDKSSSP